MYRFAALIILALTLSGCGRNLSPDEARALLQRVQQARLTATVAGDLSTSVRVRGQLLSSDGRIQRAPGIVQVKYLTGRFGGWQVIEQDGMVWRIDPHGKPTPSTAGADTGLGMRPSPDLRVHYDGPAWVARHRAARYSIEPPATANTRVALTIDAATYYPLRLERYGNDGQLVSATVYRSVDFNAAPPQRLPVPEVASPANRQRAGGRAIAADEQKLEKLLGGSLAKPTYIPPGFHLRGTFIHSLGARQVAEMRYFDGLQMLAVMQFHRPATKGLGAGNPVSPGAEKGRWAFWRKAEAGAGMKAGQEKRSGERGTGVVRPSLWRGNVIRERRGDRVIIVAGELPAEELQKIMSSIPSPPGQRPAVKF